MVFLKEFFRFSNAARKHIVISGRRKFSHSSVCYGVSRSGFDDYERERKSWNVTIPEKYNFASDVLDVWAQKEKEGKRSLSLPAFWFVYENGQEMKWSFQDLERDSKKTASMLEQNCGICRGDKVFVMLPKLPEFWLVNIAAIRTGFVLTPAATQLTAKDLAYRLAAYNPTCIIAHEDVADVVDKASESCSSLKTKVVVSSGKNSARKNWIDFHSLFQSAKPEHKCADTDSEETMMVFFTSGTTGNPKMVEHTHSYGLCHGNTGKYMLDLNSDTILWNISDTGWAKTAYSSIFSPWNHGSCVFVHQMPRFNPIQTLEILSKYPIGTFCAPPMGYRMMVQEDLKKYSFKNLEHCITGGETLNPEVNKVWKAATGMNIYEGYGQSESVMLVGMFRCLKFKSGSMGKPSPGLDVVIVDDKENEVGPNVEGEIVVKRKSERIFGLFKGYINEPELTKQRLTGKYFHTGDLGYRDEEGYFYFVGRKDDLINSAGYRIGPFEVESALMEHPAVVEVACVSSPDAERGEVVKAFVVLKDSFKVKSESDLVKELQDHAKRVTAPYKYPRKIEFVKDLPKTISGKIRRFELRKKEWGKK